MRECDHWSSGRSLAIKIGAGLLIITGALAVLRSCNESGSHVGENDRDSSDGASHSKNPDSSLMVLAAEQAVTKVNTLLAVEDGEVAVIALSPGVLEKYFRFTEPNEAEKAKPGTVRGLKIRDHGRDQLEAILRDGGELSGHIREIDERVSFPNVGLRVALRAAKGGRLDLIVGDDAGRPQYMAMLPAGVGGDLILRSAYPDPEAVLIVVKRDPRIEVE